MNLIPVVTTLCITLASGLYYLKHSEDESRAVQYRVAMSNIEKVADNLGGGLRYDESQISNAGDKIQQCQQHDLYPEDLYINPDINWRVEVLGLNCDIAKLSMSVAEEKFPLLTRAAIESGAALAEINSHTLKVHWLHRLHKRRVNEIGLKSALKTNHNKLCLRCISESSTIKIVKGNEQSASIGQSLGEDPQVKVFTNDENQTGIAGITVNFESSGDSKVDPSAVVTDEYGLASTKWILGNKAGRYDLTASVSEFSFSYIEFAATAHPSFPDSMMSVGWHTGQSGTVAELFAVRPAVKVVDQHNNPIPGELITFAINQGAGTLGDSNDQTITVTTNADGIASVSWTLGQIEGPNQLMATHSNLVGDLRFSVEGVPGPPAQLVISSQPIANPISGKIMLTQPEVLIKDRFGNMTDNSSSSITVSVEGDLNYNKGLLLGDLSVTAINGLASFSDLAFEGLINKDYRLQFTSPGLGSVTSDPIRVSLPGEPFKLEANASYHRNAEVGTQLDISVTLTDRPGNSVPSREIAFAVTSGGGSVTTPVSTNSEGVATTNWTLGTEVGTNTLIATINQLSETLQTETFTAPAAKLVIIRQPSAGGGVSGDSLETQPILQITDHLNNVIDDESYWVSAAIYAYNEARIVGGYQAQNINGAVTFNGLAVEAIVDKQFEIEFVINETNIRSTSQPLSIRNSKSAYKMRVVGGAANTGAINTDILPNPKVRILDEMDNPVSGVTIQFIPNYVFVTPYYSNDYTDSTLSVLTDFNGEAMVRWKRTGIGGKLIVNCATCQRDKTAEFIPRER